MYDEQNNEVFLMNKGLLDGVVVLDLTLFWLVPTAA